MKLRQIAEGFPHGDALRAMREERGQNLVEMAIVILFALMLIFGIVDFARAIYAYDFVAHAAREGSRYASVRGADCKLTNCTQADVVNYVKSLANGIGLDPSALADPQVTYPAESYNSGTCASTPNAPGCVVQVQVSYNFKFIFPLLPTVTVPMTSTSQMVISQ